MNKVETGFLICKLINPTNTDNLAEILSSLDIKTWDFIYEFVKSYNLQPLLYSKLYTKKLRQYLPERILNDLQKQFNLSSRDSTKREYEFKKILKLLNDNHIEVILLKGICLSLNFYENPAERPMSDIDILVKVSDLKKTVEILQEFGCKFTQDFNLEDFFSSYLENLNKLKQFSKHLPELITPKGFTLEIHWTLKYDEKNTKANIDIKEIWDTKIETHFSKVKYSLIKTELFLIYLCLNIIEDKLRQKLLQFFDIYLILNKSEINWELLLSKAKEWNCSKELLCILEVEKEIFHFNIPSVINLSEQTPNNFSSILPDLVFSDLTLAKQYENKIASEFSSQGLKEKIKLFYWAFWSKEKIFYHYGINKGFFKIQYYRIKRTNFLLGKYLKSFFSIYSVNSEKRNAIKLRESSDNLKTLEYWLESENSNNKKSVAIIHYWLDDYRGGEKVIEALCEMFPKADIYTHIYKPDKLPGTITSHNIYTTIISKLPFAGKFYRNYLLLMPLALKLLKLNKYDLIISSESGPAKGIRKREDALHICYCHSPMRYIWDMQKEYMKNKNIFIKFIWFITACIMRHWDKKSAKSVDYFIANSNFIAARIRKFYNRKAIVIHPPVEIEKFNYSKIKQEFYLCACQLVPYKKVELLVQAFNELNLPLEIIGAGPEFEKLKSSANQNIIFLGKVPDEVLKQKLETCKAFVYAGKEDFGIVLAEASAAGTPVIAFGKGGAKDIIINNKTGILFKEQTVKTIIEAVNLFNKEKCCLLATPEEISCYSEKFSKNIFKKNISTFLKNKQIK